jgi:hypothetical protein
MAHPDSLRHRRFRMTGTEPHAPRGTAGRGPNWDRGPGAGHAGAARSGTTRHRRPWAQPGPPAVDGPRRLCVDACASRHRRPRDHSWDRGPYAGRRSCVTRSGHNGCRRDAVTVCLSISCTGGHGNDHVAIILFTSRHFGVEEEGR